MPEVNLGYAHEKGKWRKGYDFEVARCVLDYGFDNCDLTTIAAVIWPENITSIRFAQKLRMSSWKSIAWSRG